MKGSIFAAIGIVLLARAAAALEPAQLRAAAAYSAAHGGKCLVIEQDGRRIFTDLPNGGSLSARYKIFSGTKMFWILAALAAEQEGLLRLDEPVAGTLPEWSADPARARITVRQLLNFTSGLEPNNALHANRFPDRNAAALRTELGAAPGSHFIYGPAALQVFHEFLRRKLAPQGLTPTRYLERRVLGPLGLGAQRYLPDGRGNPLLATGFFQSAPQWQRLGACLLRGGAPIVRPGTFAAATRGSAANPAFGMALWNNHLAPRGREMDPEAMLERPWEQQDWSNACLSRSAPGDLLACIGSGGQRLYVVPSAKLTITRQGEVSRFRDAEFLRLLFAH